MKKNILAVLSGFCFLAVLTLASLPAAIVFENTWGTVGSNLGQFSTPQSVAVDSAGNMYVADTGNDRFQILDSSGTALTAVGISGTGPGQFLQPKSIDLDAAGNIYVLELQGQRGQKFNSGCTYITDLGAAGTTNGQFTNPCGVAVFSTNTSGATVTTTSAIYVADTENFRIQRFNATSTACSTTTVTTNTNCTFATVWGQGGTTPSTVTGEFNKPWGIAVDSTGNVYVSDTENNRIQKFTSNGVFIRKWGSLGAANGQFHFPRGLAADSSGNVFVADAYNNRVQKFDTNGTFLTAFGSVGTGHGQFAFPSDVAIDSAGKIYVADKDNNRIQVFHEVADPPVIPPVVAGAGYLKIIGGVNGYVNPALGETCSIQFTAGLAGEVKINIFNSAGILFKTITSTSDGTTVSSVTYDCRDETGKFLSSGIYTVKITGPAIAMTRKLAIAR